MEYSIVERFILRSDVILEEQQLPLYDIDAIAGLEEIFASGNQVPIDDLRVPGLPRCDGAVRVTGDSMHPLLMKGDIILYKVVPNRRGGLFFGEIYLLDIVADGEEYITIKYVYQSSTPGYYTLVSENPKYTPKEVLIDNVRAMAIVKASVRCFSM
ncbi:S24 family peptidase [uncultured Alistipes sp.]|jgi:hypothetical protein|uniref:S24 family peptidase n=1 Tax=uncultured Alistipes sp. TaxID=538949 RepID=UPI0025CC531D|nr:S24 family peptidase [uncultured Alistipes sp.]